MMISHFLNFITSQNKINVLKMNEQDQERVLDVQSKLKEINDKNYTNKLEK